MATKKSEPHIAANLKYIHDQGFAAEVGIGQHDREIVHGARGPPLPVLTAIELEQYVTLERAAELLHIHVETFEATYPHLIKRVSPRCRRVKLRDLVSQTVEAA
jgi:hypothetical protein